MLKFSVMGKEFKRFLMTAGLMVSLETATAVILHNDLPLAHSIEQASKKPYIFDVASLIASQNQMIGQPVILTGWPEAPIRRKIPVDGDTPNTHPITYADEYRFFQGSGQLAPIEHVILEENYIEQDPDKDRKLYLGAKLEVVGIIRDVDLTGRKRDPYLLAQAKPLVISNSQN